MRESLSFSGILSSRNVPWAQSSLRSHWVWIFTPGVPGLPKPARPFFHFWFSARKFTADQLAAGLLVV